MTMLLKKYKNYLILTLLWFGIILIVNPIGEFPFADDFAYCGPVKKLAETDSLKMTDWSSMTLIGHIYIGTFVSKVIGFSFTNLRITNLIFFLMLTLSLYTLFRYYLKDDIKAFIGALFILFNPSFVFYSFSFMTDITFLCFFIMSLYFYIKYLDNEKSLILLLAVALNVYSYLIRDLSLILPFAFGISYFLKKGFSSKSIVRVAIPIGIIALEFLIYRYWLQNVHGITVNIDFSRKKMLWAWTSGLSVWIISYSKSLIYTIVYIGLYLSPILILHFFASKFLIPIRKKLTIFIASLVIAFGTTFIFLKVPAITKYLSHFLYSNLYFHSFYFEDVYNPSTDWIFFPSTAFNFLIFFWGLLFGIYFSGILFRSTLNIYKTYKSKKELFENSSRNFLLLTISAYSFIIFSQFITDRYIFPLIPIVILYIISELDLQKIKSKFSIILAVCLFVFTGVYFSLAGSRDMMEFNRTRMKAYSFLENELKASPAKIDGGFEYNAWRFYNYYYKSPAGMNFWWVQNDEYVVSWGEIKGRKVIREYEYTKIFPPFFKAKIFVSRKIE